MTPRTSTIGAGQGNPNILDLLAITVDPNIEGTIDVHFFCDDDNLNDVCLSEFEEHDKRRSILIEHYDYMRSNGTLNLELR